MMESKLKPRFCNTRPFVPTTKLHMQSLPYGPWTYGGNHCVLRTRTRKKDKVLEASEKWTSEGSYEGTMEGDQNRGWGGGAREKNYSKGQGDLSSSLSLIYSPWVQWLLHALVSLPAKQHSSLLSYPQRALWGLNKIWKYLINRQERAGETENPFE